METWQKQIIEKCLPTLIALTKCSTGLKSELRAKQLITLEEDEQLVSIYLFSSKNGYVLFVRSYGNSCLFCG